MIYNVNVYGLDESIKASGYPKNIKLMKNSNINDNDINRAESLGHADHGSGHDCFLKGIIVQHDIFATQAFWQQWQRYHFHDIISSQSKMHNILKLSKNKENFHYLVEPSIINTINEMVNLYNSLDNSIEWMNIVYNKKEFFQKIIYNVPMGFKLGARVNTNYLQLKTIYEQRKHHRLEEWLQYCGWIETLQSFKTLIL